MDLQENLAWIRTLSTQITISGASGFDSEGYIFARSYAQTFPP